MVEPTKVCSMCKQRKHWSEFYNVSRENHLPGSRCKPCNREHQRQYRASHPDRVKQYRRTNYERVKADPERYTVRIVQGREWKRRTRGTRPEDYRVSRVMRAAEQGWLRDQLPSAPFTAWLRMVIERDGEPIVNLGDRLGVSERMLRLILGGQPSVELGTVERALIADGATLMDVYPDLYALAV